MEINKFDDVIGVVTAEAIVEGSFVLLTSHSQSYNFGSRTDLPAVKKPATAEEAKNARYILTWAQNNSSMPMYQPNPSFAFSLRRGAFDQATNMPMTGVTVYTTYPGMMESFTIPSGTPSLAFAEGVFTVPSGMYIDGANIKVTGANVVVANTAEDGAGSAGKLKYQSTMDERVVGRVIEWNSSNAALTVKTID